MSLSEKIEQINREIGATVESALSDLRRELAQRVRASSDEIARHVEELALRLPSSFLSHDELTPFTESAAREAAESAAREASEKAAREAAEKASRSAASAAATAARGSVATLRDALAAIDRARSQADILAALLRETAERYGLRAAIVLVRGGEMRGWAGQGFGDGDAALRSLAFNPNAGGGWSRLADGGATVHLSAADCAELCSRIEASLPHEGVLVPLVLRDRVAAGLYADQTDGRPQPPVEALQILTYAAAQGIELLPFRERPSTPTLQAEEGLAFTPPAAEPEPAAAPASPASDPTFATSRTEALAPAPATEPAPAAAVPDEPEIEIEAEPEPSEPVTGMQEAASPWAPAAPAADFEAEAMPDLPAVDAALETPETPETEIEPEPEPEPEPAAAAPAWSAPAAEPSPAATVFQPIPQEALRSVDESAPASTAAFRVPEPSADATVLLQRPNLREVAPPPAPLRPVPPPAPEPAQDAAGGAVPEVRPPSGVEGPGWAFATSRVAVSPSDDAQHEEARRLARLLVSEIKLYNEEQVEEGRRRKDVYERLKEDIDRSRQMYEERVEPRILKSTDYFYQELVRILAAGDAKALGI